jgi:hypothetical protein
LRWGRSGLCPTAQGLTYQLFFFYFLFFLFIFFWSEGKKDTIITKLLLYETRKVKINDISFNGHKIYHPFTAWGRHPFLEAYLTLRWHHENTIEKGFITFIGLPFPTHRQKWGVQRKMIELPTIPEQAVALRNVWNNNLISTQTPGTPYI